MLAVLPATILPEYSAPFIGTPLHTQLTLRQLTSEANGAPPTAAGWCRKRLHESRCRIERTIASCAAPLHTLASNPIHRHPMTRPTTAVCPGALRMPPRSPPRGPHHRFRAHRAVFQLPPLVSPPARPATGFAFLLCILAFPANVNAPAQPPVRCERDPAADPTAAFAPSPAAGFVPTFAFNLH
ncbi:hypothetical protein B0H19DRAFT_1375145 [Mycena capillaripes]|nr:hypothetical protein B0H19DRAFT_1375145 [Mycena capillaripes]